MRHALACALAGFLVALPAAGFAAPAQAQAQWTINGKGWGHGIGMSQYGAQARAQNGRSFRQIIRHYYTNVSIGQVSSRRVKVLLATQSQVGFQRARRACGRQVNPERRFTFAGTSQIRLVNQNGKVLRNCGSVARANGPGGIRIMGHGRYRGRLVARATGSAQMVINNVPLEGYIKGVVPNEMPASWHQQALRAQAVAARSYGLATSRSGAFDHYADTRSQVYGGRRSETQATNRAVNQTQRLVARHGGSVATTFYHSTSGGRTEHVENVWGGSPIPYLKSVNDNPDRISPVHSWRVTYSQAQMRSRLNHLVPGNFRRFGQIQRGASPRIIRARLIGSSGRNWVAGSTLRTALALRSTWAFFNRN